MHTEYLGPIDQTNIPIVILEQTALKIQHGRLLAFPTKTVYGIGTSIFNNTAIQQLYAIKQKPKAQLIPIYISNLNQIKFLATDISQEFYRVADELLPAPITIILKKHPNFSSSFITGNKDTIAVHFSPCSVVQRLIELTGCPLAITAANILGKPRSIQAQHVLEDFNGTIDGILDGGQTDYGLESTILSLENPKIPTIFRLGVILPRTLEKIIKQPVKIHPLALLKQESRFSNQLKANIRLFSNWEELDIYLKLSLPGKRLIMHTEKPPFKTKYKFFALNSKNFYEGIRLAERENYTETLVHCSSKVKSNEALFNRLKQLAKV